MILLRTSLRPACILAVGLLLLASSCEDGSTTINYPPARTPELMQIERGVVGQPRKEVRPNTGGQYEALPAAALFVRARAPYPLKAEVSINNEVLEESPDPARQDELERAGKAYFVVLEIILTQDSFEWQFRIFLPPTLRAARGLALAIKMISLDPDASGQDKISDPLALAVVPIPCGSAPPLPPLPQELGFYQVEPKKDPLNFASTSPNPTESDPCGKNTVVITSVKNESTDSKDNGVIIDLTYHRFNMKEVTVRLRPAEETAAFNDLQLDNQWKLRVQFLSAPLLDPSKVHIEIGWKPQ